MRDQSSILYITENADTIFRKLRWGDSVHCPYCGHTHIYTYKDGSYKCSHCHKHFSDKSNTIFHASHLTKAQWLIALYLMMQTKGVSSIELSNLLGITQKSAWLALSKLRYMFDQSDVILEGQEIAVDECYLGQNSSGMHLAKRQSLIAKYNLPTKPKNKEERQAVLNAINAREKQPVYGMNDGNKIVLLALPNPFSARLIREQFMRHSTPSDVFEEPKYMVSDCGYEYYDWANQTGWLHSTNNHSKGKFVTDDGRSSNRIEGNFRWIESKRSYVNVHYSHRLTQLYLNEVAFRHNHRNDSIEHKLEEAFKCIHCRFDKEDLKDYDPIKKFNSRKKHKDFGYIVELLKNGLIEEIKESGLVWRAKDFR